MNAFVSYESKDVHLDYGLFELTRVKVSKHSETSKMLTIQYRLKTSSDDLKTMHRRMIYDDSLEELVDRAEVYRIKTTCTTRYRATPVGLLAYMIEDV